MSFRRSPMIEPVERRLMLTTYYVSPAGSDAALGTSPATAWQTVEKINALDLNAGDQVLFEGGQTFTVPTGVRTNVVGNPGFESGVFGEWNEDFNSANRTSITSVAAEVHSGTKALKLEGSGGRGQDITAVLQPYRTYELKFWAKYTAGNGNQAFVGVTLSTPGGNQTAYVQIPATGVYTEYSIGLTTPGDFFYADVWTTNSQGTSNLFLDDVSLRESQVLRFDASDSGAAGAAVVIGSFGAGRATLNAGTGSGVIAENVANIELRDLNLTGTWNGLTATGTNGGTGVHLLNTQPGGTKLDHVYVENVDASGFKWAGASAQGVQQKSGFNDLRIRNVAAHDNGDAGISVSGFFDFFSAAYAHTNVTIDNSFAYNNGGIPDKGSHSGHGIVVSDVNGATIERNIAHDNGALNNSPAGGPVGIWAWDSNAVTIQFNESYANKTGATGQDGGGFDLDGGVTNSVMQFNYSHDNMGPGFLLYQFAGARAYGNNTVRYNISQNDARHGDYAAIFLGGGVGMTNNHVYQNTIYVTPSATAPLLSAVKFFGLGAGNKVRNNIFYVTGGVPLINSDANYATSIVQFQGNDYYVASGAFQVLWGGTPYASLAAWRTATSQEINGANTGTTANPMLVNPGGGGTIGDAYRLHTLTAYQFLPASPARNAGVNLTTLGVSVGPRDYFGATPNAGGNFDIGAFEWRDSFVGSADSDTFTLRVGPGGLTELFVNTPTSGVPRLVWHPSVYDLDYSIHGNASDDTFVLDMSGGNPLPSNAILFDAGTGTNDTVVVNGSSGNDTMFVNGNGIRPVSTDLRQVAFAAGVDSLLVNGGAGHDNLKWHDAGMPTVFNGNTGNDTLDVNTGTFTFNTNAALGNENLTVNVATGRSVVFNASQQLAALNLIGAAAATLTAGGEKVLLVKSLTLGADAVLNLTDNDLAIDYTGSSPLGSATGGVYDGVLGLVANGANFGAWDGKGIITDRPDALAGLTSIGLAEAADVLGLGPTDSTDWGGVTVDGSTVLVKYTYAGDANLDGFVSGDDYASIDGNVSLPGSSGWYNGDFNYDGIISGDDYAAIDSNIVAQGPPL